MTDYQKLMELERQAKITGRKQHKKIAEIQMRMLLEGQQMLKDSMACSASALANCDKLLEQRQQLFDENILLQDMNNEMFWKLQEIAANPMREYHA